MRVGCASGGGGYLTSDPIGLRGGLNTYAYVSNNPLSNIDPLGLLTVFVHGTFSDPAGGFPDREFVNKITQDTGDMLENIRFLDWRGFNNSVEARTEAANALVELIDNYQFAEGEVLNIISHSHGGNVSIEAANILAQREICDSNNSNNSGNIVPAARNISNLVLLGTPSRSDYILDSSASVDRFINIYSNDDRVQPVGGRIQDLGVADRERAEAFAENFGFIGTINSGGSPRSRRSRERAIENAIDEGFVGIDTAPLGHSDFQNIDNYNEIREHVFPE